MAKVENTVRSIEATITFNEDELLWLETVVGGISGFGPGLGIYEAITKVVVNSLIKGTRSKYIWDTNSTRRIILNDSAE